MNSRRDYSLLLCLSLGTMKKINVFGMLEGKGRRRKRRSLF